MCGAKIDVHQLLVVFTTSTNTVWRDAMPHCAMPCCARCACVQFDVREERRLVSCCFWRCLQQQCTEDWHLLALHTATWQPMGLRDLTTPQTPGYCVLVAVCL
jgi:hypothetical protein